jgi:cell division control protein 6
VFRDESKLDLSYVPDRLPHRDAELRLLKEFFSFLRASPLGMAQRVVVTGDVGSGKTALCQRFGADIVRDAVANRGVTVRYVHVNCREFRGSLFLVLRHVVGVFHPNFPRRGYSAEELLGFLLQVLDEANGYVVLTLDEFDSLVEREGSDAVYKLTRLQETRQGLPQRLSLICVVRHLGVLSGLDASTRSSLQSNVIRLENYSSKELVDILRDRVSLAFRVGAVPDATVELIGDLAVSENGNARFGIELLWRAGKYADADGVSVVVPELVRRAVSNVVPSLRKSDLISLGFHEKLFLLGIAVLFRESGEACVSLAEAERAYAVACEEFGVAPVSHTQLWKYLNGLASAGILRTEVSSSGSRGRSTLIYLSRVSGGDLEKELRVVLGREHVADGK